jgi:hypothetical protein
MNLLNSTSCREKSVFREQQKRCGRKMSSQMGRTATPGKFFSVR